jgi:hypothetical protein
MIIREHYLAATSQCNATRVTINVADISEVLGVFARGDVLYLSTLEDEKSEIKNHRTFLTMGMGVSGELDIAPYRFIGHFKTEQPSWWNQNNGTFWPMIYYVFEVLG